MNMRIRMAFILVFSLAVSIPVYSGSEVVGTVVGSEDATIDGQALKAGSDLHIGDQLQVRDGEAVIATGQGDRIRLGHHTQVSFLGEGPRLSLLLGKGNITIYQPERASGLNVKAGTIVVRPAPEFATLCELSMVDGVVVLKARKGKLEVEGDGPAMEVTKGKTVELRSNPGPAPKPSGAKSQSRTTRIAIVAGAAAAGVGGGFAVAAHNNSSDALAAAQQATAAAQAAAAAAQAACEAALSGSGSNPSACH